LVGGFTESRPVTSQNGLSKEERTIDEWIRKNDQSIAGWEFVSIRTQVVAGVNYCLTYENSNGKTQERCVWSKPWENDFLKM